MHASRARRAPRRGGVAGEAEARHGVTCECLFKKKSREAPGSGRGGSNLSLVDLGRGGTVRSALHAGACLYYHQDMTHSLRLAVALALISATPPPTTFRVWIAVAPGANGTNPRTFAGVVCICPSVSEVAFHPPTPKFVTAELRNRHFENGPPWLEVLPAMWRPWHLAWCQWLPSRRPATVTWLEGLSPCAVQRRPRAGPKLTALTGQMRHTAGANHANHAGSRACYSMACISN